MMYWFRSSMPILAATSGSSFRFSTENCRPPVCSAISVNRLRPASSSGVSPRATRHRLEDADRIDLYIRFPHQALDFTFRITAAIIAAIRNNKQRLARVLGLFHVMQRQVNRVQQRGASLGLRESQAVLDLFQMGS